MSITKTKPTIIFGADHAGYVLKEVLKDYLLSLGFNIEDKGTFSVAPVDYPDFVFKVAEDVASSRNKKFGVVLGGTGIGECIAANKVKGIRGAEVYDQYTARMSREHNNANIVCFGGRTITKDSKYTKGLLKIWLETKFSGDSRHARRLKKITKYENS